MNANLEDRLEEVIRNLDAEDLHLCMLVVQAVARKDDRLVAALQGYRGIARQDDEDGDCETDLALLSRIKAACPEEEVVAWGGALAWCVIRGDLRRAKALQEIMRRRVMH